MVLVMARKEAEANSRATLSMLRPKGIGDVQMRVGKQLQAAKGI
jgi:hypothetical protein